MMALVHILDHGAHTLVPQQSFHPNHDGWKLYGDVFTESLVRLGL